MIVEIVGCSVSDCVGIAEAGADRIELCAGIVAGGVTPSSGLLKAVKARDAEAIAKAVKEVNESKTVKAKAEHIVDRSIVALATFARLNSRLVSLAAFSRLLRLDRRGHTF